MIMKRRKIFNKAFVFVTMFCVLLTFCSCKNSDIGNNENNTKKVSQSSVTEVSSIMDTDVTEFKIPLSLVAVSGRESDILADEFKDGKNCTSVTVNSDDSITVTLTEEQLDYWINSNSKMLENLDNELKSINPNYKIIHNEDFTQLDLYYDLNLDAQKAVNYIFQAEFFCGMFQVFTNPAENNFNIEVNIYNCATGNIVTSGELILENEHYKQNLSYDETDWQKSK